MRAILAGGGTGGHVIPALLRRAHEARLANLPTLTVWGTGLPRQFCLMLAVWIHGCIGLHMFLRIRPWYHRAVAWLRNVLLEVAAGL